MKRPLSAYVRKTLILCFSAILVCALVPLPSISYAIEGGEGADAQEQIDAPTEEDTATSNDDSAEEDVASADESEEDAATSDNDSSEEEDSSDQQTSSADEAKAQDDTPQESQEQQAEPNAADVNEGQSLSAQDNGALDVATIIERMTLDEKISQLIIPAIRTWNDVDVTDLSAVPDLAAALRKHQYGGIILFGANVKSAAQTSTLVSALQSNNAAGEFSTKIPYLMPVDEEGGVVVRFSMGTRMTGNMAVGATGSKAEENARTTGRILGEEINALGFNVDLAPSIDVNSNPANPVIGVRSFSDDPNTVATLGLAFNKGLADKNVIGTIKHFPGHGDTATDTHIGVAAVNKTHEQLQQVELVPFKAAIEAGVDLIMTAHVTLPAFDTPVTFFNGTQGHYPATMSKTVITDLLRNELGYTGVVITDALEMDAIDKAGLVAGEQGSAEYAANVAVTCLNAGVDLLLLPRDLKNPDIATFYDEYIQRIADKVSADNDLAARVDESLTRVLNLKRSYGILEGSAPNYGLDVIGSHEHHEAEMRIANEAITLIKNDDHTLPASAHNKKIVLLSRDKNDNVMIASIINELKQAGLVDEDTFVNNLSAGTTSGSEDASSRITIDYFYDAADAASAHYTDELKQAIAEADYTVALSKNWSIAALQASSGHYLGIANTLADTHAAGGKFVLISGNLPYDSARFQDADAILCSYMSSGTDTDPTARQDESASVGAYNANAIAAFKTVFDANQPMGTLPVRIPALTTNDDGTVAYDVDATLYERGHGLSYEYLFTQGNGSTYEHGSKQDLVFVNNARHDLLQSVLVDDEELGEDHYTVEQGSTIVTLKGDYLDTLKDGEHVLKAIYAYDNGNVDIAATFTVQGNDTTTEEEGTQDPGNTPDTPSDTGTPATTDGTSGTSTGSTTGGTTPAATAASAAPNPVRSASSTPATASRQSAAATTSSLARTGDSTSMVVPVVLAMAAVNLIAGALAYKRKKN